MDKQYRRALTLLRGTDLIEQDVRFRYLAAKCLVECQEWEESLKMVGGWEDDSLDSIDMQVVMCRAAVTGYRAGCGCQTGTLVTAQITCTSGSETA